eukprot:SAG31_NODE_343_length_17426_cov_35.294443_2_plen_91_part_00
MNLAAPGLNINITDANGATALIRAIRDYKTEAVRLILEAGIDVNIQETRWPWGTALINAAMKATEARGKSQEPGALYTERQQCFGSRPHA